MNTAKLFLTVLFIVCASSLSNLSATQAPQQTAFLKSHQMLDLFSDKYEKARALLEIGKYEAKAGLTAAARAMLNQARDTADQYTHANIKASLLARIAEAQAEAGFTDDAKVTLGYSTKALEKDKDPYLSLGIGITYDIAIAQSKIGLKKEAKATLDAGLSLAKELEPKLQILILCRTATNAARIGLIPYAKTIMAEVASLIEPVAVEANRQKPSLAPIIGLAVAFNFSRNFDDAVIDIAVAEVEAGDIESAYQTIEMFHSQLLKIRGLTELAITLNKRGQTQEANNALDKAQMFVKSSGIRSSSFYGDEELSAISRLAVAQSKLGRTSLAKGSFGLVSVIAGTRKNYEVINNIANDQVEAGLPDKALGTYNKIPSKNKKFHEFVLRDAAVAKAEAGDPVGARQIANNIKDAEQRNFALLKVELVLAYKSVENQDTQ